MWRRWVTIALAVTVGAAVAVSGGTWVYLHVLRDPPPERLTLDAAAASPVTTTVPSDPAEAAPAEDSAGIEGTWKVTAGSEAGYRVPEVLNGQDAEAVGRTTKVTGQVTITGTKVTTATFSVDMASVASDESRRDNQFRNRIMDVGTHPTSTFVLSAPIELGTAATDGRTTAEATGRLTLKGVTREVSLTVEAQRDGATVKVAGSIPVTFSDYGIANPSAGPARVGNEGEVEFLLVLAR
jgi:polyisoprenoid-binding protein YceI